MSGHQPQSLVTWVKQPPVDAFSKIVWKDWSDQQPCWFEKEGFPSVLNLANEQTGMRYHPKDSGMS